MNYVILFAVIIIAIVAGAMVEPMLDKYRRVFCVPEGWTGLVYHHGLFIRRSNAGRHVIWGCGWTMSLIDLRKASTLVPGQEVLTADRVGLNISLILRHHVTDPVKSAHETQSSLGDLCNAAQLALRSVVSGVTAEALLNQRLEIDAQLLTRVRPRADEAGLNVLAVEVKDVIFPAELKRAFADVLKAKQEGQAALERARSESASLRDLANAARVLEGNPALMHLRLMQSLTGGQNGGHTLILGAPGGFLPLKQQAKPPSTERNEET